MPRGRKCLALAPSTSNNDAGVRYTFHNDDDIVSMSVMPVEIVEKVLRDLTVLSAETVSVNQEIYRNLALVCHQWQDIVKGTHFKQTFKRHLIDTYGSIDACRKYGPAVQLTITGLPHLFGVAVAMHGTQLFLARNNRWDPGAIEVYDEDVFDPVGRTLSFRNLRTILMSFHFGIIQSIEFHGSCLFVFPSNAFATVLSVDTMTGQVTPIALFAFSVGKIVSRGGSVYGLTADTELYKALPKRGLACYPVDKCLTRHAPQLLPTNNDALRDLLIVLAMSVTGRRCVIKDSDGCILAYFPRTSLRLYGPNMRLWRDLGGQPRRNRFSMWLDEPRRLLYVLTSNWSIPNYSFHAYSLQR